MLEGARLRGERGGTGMILEPECPGEPCGVNGALVFLLIDAPETGVHETVARQKILNSLNDLIRAQGKPCKEGEPVPQLSVGTSGSTTRLVFHRRELKGAGAEKETDIFPPRGKRSEGGFAEALSLAIDMTDKDLRSMSKRPEVSEPPPDQWETTPNAHKTADDRQTEMLLSRPQVVFAIVTAGTGEESANSRVERLCAALREAVEDRMRRQGWVFLFVGLGEGSSRFLKSDLVRLSGRKEAVFISKDATTALSGVSAALLSIRQYTCSYRGFMMDKKGQGESRDVPKPKFFRAFLLASAGTIFDDEKEKTGGLQRGGDNTEREGGEDSGRKEKEQWRDEKTVNPEENSFRKVPIPPGPAYANAKTALHAHTQKEPLLPTPYPLPSLPLHSNVQQRSVSSHPPRSSVPAPPPPFVTVSVSGLTPDITTSRLHSALKNVGFPPLEMHAGTDPGGGPFVRFSKLEQAESLLREFPSMFLAGQKIPFHLNTEPTNPAVEKGPPQTVPPTSASLSPSLTPSRQNLPVDPRLPSQQKAAASLQTPATTGTTPHPPASRMLRDIALPPAIPQPPPGYPNYPCSQSPGTAAAAEATTLLHLHTGQTDVWESTTANPKHAKDKAPFSMPNQPPPPPGPPPGPPNLAVLPTPSRAPPTLQEASPMSRRHPPQTPGPAILGILPTPTAPHAPPSSLQKRHEDFTSPPAPTPSATEPSPSASSTSLPHTKPPIAKAPPASLTSSSAPSIKLPSAHASPTVVPSSSAPSASPPPASAPSASLPPTRTPSSLPSQNNMATLQEDPVPPKSAPTDAAAAAAEKTGRLPRVWVSGLDEETTLESLSVSIEDIGVTPIEVSLYRPTSSEGQPGVFACAQFSSEQDAKALVGGGPFLLMDDGENLLFELARPFTDSEAHLQSLPKIWILDLPRGAERKSLAEQIATLGISPVEVKVVNNTHMMQGGKCVEGKIACVWFATKAEVSILLSDGPSKVRLCGYSLRFRLGRRKRVTVGEGELFDVCVTQLATTTTAETLRAGVSRLGLQPLHLHVPRCGDSAKKNEGFGFVSFQTEKEAAALMRVKVEIDGKTVGLEWADIC
uniref:RRM domain-containing protein n=1 Tax=Chromera velia CCMP2878 TaxID=1169474 RepID=A0A0G4GK61_9ALVE|eukprot:Cvel_22263.t1-p1 / transcript=Cvel_22263.t1 / gene=Cvel_22263 / organism=Chromera_velia_CCMP2878 / gene_product=hypothetical protein / transcript_product=hypothetical protein / location=Cvel_scaffold2171:18508-22397(-) / protein_length=1081 / sequence_SO=supercontig / SO=protein_coding / is_pseudo=false